MSRGYNRRRFVVRVLVSSKLRTVISVANTIFTLGGLIRCIVCIALASHRGNLRGNRLSRDEHVSQYLDLVEIIE